MTEPIDNRPARQPKNEPKPLRVATFLAAATEMVWAMGLQDRLVGISHECDYPASVLHLPRLTQARISAPNSRAIHEDMDTLLRQALALYEIDLEKLKALSPDVLITQDLCQVCAVPLAQVEIAASKALGHKVSIISLQPKRLHEVWEDVVRVGEALNLGMTAQAVANGFKSRLLRLQREVAKLELSSKPRVLALEWLDPWMVGGYWMPDLIEAAGCEAVAAQAGEPGRVIDNLALLEGLEVDLILVKPCGFTLETTHAELEGEAGRKLAELKAFFPKAKVVLADGNAFFNRSGPRLVESAEILAAAAFGEDLPELQARHQGRYQTWEPV